jgi:hypothetical protein
MATFESLNASIYQKTNFAWQLRQLQQRWNEGLEGVLARFRPNWSWSDSGPGPWPQSLSESLFWLILLGGAALLVWWLNPQVRSVWRRWRSRPMTSPPVPAAARVQSVSGWLRQAQDWQQQGNYAEACRSLYFAMLQRLHERHAVPHQSSRTDGEYLQLVEHLPRAQAYRVLIQTHERVCFGDQPIEGKDYQRCQRAYQALDTPSTSAGRSRGP